jgi:hypothetical protein
MDHAALAAWVGVSSARGAIEPGAEEHSYLFGRPDGPEPLPVVVASRAMMVAVCSGLVLLLGVFLILGRRPLPVLWWLAVMGFGLSVAALIHPSLTIQALQSGTVGLLLSGLVAVLQRFLGGRRAVPAEFGERSGRDASFLPGSSLSRTLGVGSDDSTAIRSRPVSTMDYVVTAVPPPTVEVDGAAAGSSRKEPASRGSGGA